MHVRFHLLLEIQYRNYNHAVQVDSMNVAILA